MPLNAKYNIKGVAVKALKGFAIERLGEQGVIEMLDSLSPAMRDLFGRNFFIVSDWYDVENVYLPFLEEICERSYNGNIKAGAWAYGRYSAETGLKKIYRIFLKMGSPEFIVSRAGQLLSLYHNPGRVEIVESSKKHCLFRIFDMIPRKTMYWEIAGYIDMMLDLIGRKQHGVEIKSFLSENSPYTEMMVSWE